MERKRAAPAGFAGAHPAAVARDEDPPPPARAILRPHSVGRDAREAFAKANASSSATGGPQLYHGEGEPPQVWEHLPDCWWCPAGREWCVPDIGVGGRWMTTAHRSLMSVASPPSLPPSPARRAASPASPLSPCQPERVFRGWAPCPRTHRRHHSARPRVFPTVSHRGFEPAAVQGAQDESRHAQSVRQGDWVSVGTRPVPCATRQHPVLLSLP